MIPADIPEFDPNALPALAAEAMRVNGALVGEILLNLPQSKHDEITVLLRGGASLAVETLVRDKSFRVLLVGIEQEGRRVVIAEVQPPSATPPSLSTH